MSLVQLMFQTATSTALSGLGRRTQIGWAAVDVAISTEHTREAEATQHPVEYGVMISDHIVRRPARLEISGFVTDTPLFAAGFSLGTARSSATFHLLNSMLDARAPIYVLTPRRLYPSMVIERVRVPEGREGALRFECSMKEITQVFSQSIALPPTAEVSQGSTAASAGTGGGTGRLVEGNVADPTHAAGTGGNRASAPEAPARTQGWLAKLAGIGA
ncbi:MAG: hypothetical protein DI556_09815 [Rhodovulum sulfidophilum]|uniref:Dit-like phage tail protein N-terminal domain-containing protein n=1 Tax=Rhodovulum sulfidophilum TaxID=35806 RepID=A0A2W5NB34_RHOSU|nr:MAG: hypothetical protein DI556_09815 [Rhodovulum sulfidophilum]